MLAAVLCRYGPFSRRRKYMEDFLLQMLFADHGVEVQSMRHTILSPMPAFLLLTAVVVARVAALHAVSLNAAGRLRRGTR